MHSSLTAVTAIALLARTLAPVTSCLGVVGRNERPGATLAFVFREATFGVDLAQEFRDEAGPSRRHRRAAIRFSGPAEMGRISGVGRTFGGGSRIST